jgi:hypothetical protein
LASISAKRARVKGEAVKVKESGSYSQQLIVGIGFASKAKIQLLAVGIFINAPMGLRPPAQGCRFGYPGNWSEEKFQPQRGCVVFSAQSRCNRVAVEDMIVFFTQGSRSGNPGLQAIAPLGHH